MKWLMGGSATLLLAITCGTAAHASDTDIFAGCDGYGKPGKSADGLGSPANTIRYGFYASGSAQSTIAACDAALSHRKLLPKQGLRRAHLLRARAIAHLKSNELSKALVDIDLAGEAAGGSNKDDALYLRSMAVSLDLLRALTYAQMGNSDEALRLARQSVAARPYSLEVQRVTAHLLLTHGEHDSIAKASMQMASKLDPDFADYLLTILGFTGNFKAMAELSLPPAPEIPEHTDDAQSSNLAALNRKLSARSQIPNGMMLAYARAATGDVAGARRDMEEVKARFAKLSASTADPDAQTGQLKPFADIISSYEMRIEARIDLQEGRTAEALKRITDVKMPLDAASIDLLQALHAAQGKSDSSLSHYRAERQTAARKKLFNEMVELAMIEPETESTNSVYKRSRPNVLGALVGAAFTMGFSLLEGVKNTDGFSATPNEDGTVLISLTGATTAPAVVREMTLLRAAETAIQAGKPAFVISSRHDYSRTLRSTQYGTTVSSIPTGYKTEMTVRFLTPDEDDPRSLDAKAIIERLGPFYYKES
ncbi:tetratricopeptide repeat protein [Novosphingobium beihaiensis]|uniref:Tetratricopeptide repeat protein n=1 Tax=Novosphingobium beihaiensis TaxID=2930389 RepID=A0ABT0BSU7_9SPHN|nr:hypothetical protein [Novosphingobium beihaiensis]MCJ2188134.1 hypothetical protein [Novosphingobium beihaiensis]